MAHSKGKLKGVWDRAVYTDVGGLGDPGGSQGLGCSLLYLKAPAKGAFYQLHGTQWCRRIPSVRGALGGGTQHP